MKVTVNGRKLIIEADIAEAPQASKSGKNIILATSGGNVATEAQFNGKRVTVGFSAYFKP